MLDTSPVVNQSTPSAVAPTSSLVSPLSNEQVPAAPKAKKSMKKPILVAVILLLLLGIGGTLFILTQQKPEKVALMPKVISKNAPLTLQLESPSDGDVIEGKVLSIKGKTSPNTTVAFFSDTADGTTESDASGNFTGTLTLENGINTITIAVYGEGGEEKSTTIDVVYDETEESNTQ